VQARGPRIPSLDGLRAVSVALVVFSHLAGNRGFPLPARLLDQLDPGGLGVRVFFVISGFLISRILFDELAATGRVQLARFYVRRTLRIFPPYYAVLAALAVLMAVGIVQLPARDLLAAATYTANYFPERAWKVSHTWSLAVEEHVYLVWPALLACLGRGRGLVVAAVFAIAAPLLRVAYGLFAPGLEIPVRSETIADAIAVGCLLAGARESLHARAWYRRLLGSRAVLALPLVIVAAHELQPWPLLELAVGYSVVNLGIALLIDRVVTHPHGPIGRVLNSRVMVGVGVMSYSIYLWQELVLDRYCTRAVCAFPLNLGVVVLAALGSYLVIERPSLTLRKWLEPRLFRQAEAARPDTVRRAGEREAGVPPRAEGSPAPHRMGQSSVDVGGLPRPTQVG
jgi:peptidoglycan/LPS O-acetylase OafA/YrhL